MSRLSFLELFLNLEDFFAIFTLLEVRNLVIFRGKTKSKCHFGKWTQVLKIRVPLLCHLSHHCRHHCPGMSSYFVYVRVCLLSSDGCPGPLLRLSVVRMAFVDRGSHVPRVVVARHRVLQQPHPLSDVLAVASGLGRTGGLLAVVTIEILVYNREVTHRLPKPCMSRMSAVPLFPKKVSRFRK